MSFSPPRISILRSSVSLHRTVWQVFINGSGEIKAFIFVCYYTVQSGSYLSMVREKLKLSYSLVITPYSLAGIYQWFGRN